VAAFAVLVAMLLRLPREVAVIRAIDTHMTLDPLCSAEEDGALPACLQLSSASSQLVARVTAASKDVTETCLHASEGGIALRCPSGAVYDISNHVERLLD